MGREFLVNADFDLSLRRGWRRSEVDARSRQSEELPMHLLLLGCTGDSILLPEEPPGEFLGFLEDHGLSRPSFNLLPEIDREARFTPFGWNRAAADLNQRYLRPESHPPFEVVRRVNGRRFSAGLEQRFGDDSHVLGEYSVLEGLEATLADRPAREEGWMLKADHGNAGLGNRRLRSRHLSETDRELARRLLAEDEFLLLERWRPRVLDIAATFDLAEDGEVRGAQLHEMVNTADGAFIGALFDRDSPTIGPWRREICGAVALVAEHLVAAGYYGPVCIDAFVWEEAGAHRLRPLVDLNARMHVSAPILRLWRRWKGDRVVFWRFFSARKFALPDSYAELEDALGDDAFDPGARRGVLLTSPLRLRQESRRPARVGVVFAGTQRAEIEKMERRFRKRFER